jgi:hypothetical protein
MIRAELIPVILTPISLFKRKITRTTKAMESPKDRATLSTVFTCFPLKNTSVQQKPGKKNTNINARVARRTGTCSRKGSTKSDIANDISPYLKKSDNCSISYDRLVVKAAVWD